MSGENSLGGSDQEWPALSDLMNGLAYSAGDIETLSLAFEQKTFDSSFSSEIFHRLVKPSILKWFY